VNLTWSTTAALSKAVSKRWRSMLVARPFIGWATDTLTNRNRAAAIPTLLGKPPERREAPYWSSKQASNGGWVTLLSPRSLLEVIKNLPGWPTFVVFTKGGPLFASVSKRRSRLRVVTLLPFLNLPSNP
jgi:hypothetical protein